MYIFKVKLKIFTTEKREKSTFLKLISRAFLGFDQLCPSLFTLSIQVGFIFTIYLRYISSLILKLFIILS